MADGALQGVKVLELGHMVALPSCCAVLADSGADVIKIENPKGGDPLRNAMQVEDVKLTDIPIWFENSNRNKRSITLDIATEHSREILYKLIEQADVFATNYEARLLERIKADYETLSSINPGLIYAHFTGYGSEGPDKDKPGFDYAAFWARSGIMDRIGEPGGDPRPQRPGLGDNLSSLALAGAIGTALFNRERTRLGQKVSLSLYQFGVWGLSWDIAVALHLGKLMSQTNRKAVANPLWNSYQTRDGKWMQLVIGMTDMYWPQFCQAIGQPELIDDPKFNSHEKRMNQNMTLIPMIEEIMAGKDYTEWDDLFKQHSLLYGVVFNPLDVVKDPQAWANDFFAEVEHPVTGKVKLIESPIQFSRTPARVRSAAPALGQNTEEILLELNYDWDDIAAFKNDGTIL